MTDRDALYAAILTHPDEDTPRLVFADWLEENGDETYAAFIRKQIELAKVPEWDPLWIQAWNYDTHAISGYRYTKFVPKKLPPGLGWPSFTSFRRGFIWQVETSGEEPFLENADELVAAVPLQALTVSGTDESRDPLNMKALLASQHMARMKHIGFSFVDFAATAIRKMQECPHLSNLTSLTFENAEFGSGAQYAIFKSPLIEQLETLRFDDCRLNWNSLVKGLVNAGGPHRLQSFRISDDQRGFEFAEALNMPLLIGLRELEASGRELGDHGFGVLCSSPIFASLESLTLNEMMPGDRGIEELVGCAALKGLKRLQLESNRIRAAAMKLLVESPHLAGLRVLNLRSNPIGDKGVIALAEAPFIANLTSLNLMDCKIGDAGAEAIMNAVSADKIITLILTASNISNGMQRKLRKKFGGCVHV